MRKDCGSDEKSPTLFEARGFLIDLNSLALAYRTQWSAMTTGPTPSLQTVHHGYRQTR